jgi:hypothetical protein
MDNLTLLTDEEFYLAYESVAECAAEARGEIARFGDCYCGGQEDLARERAFARENQRRVAERLPDPPAEIWVDESDVPF